MTLVSALVVFWLVTEAELLLTLGFAALLVQIASLPRRPFVRLSSAGVRACPTIAETEVLGSLLQETHLLSKHLSTEPPSPATFLALQNLMQPQAEIPEVFTKIAVCSGFVKVIPSFAFKVKLQDSITQTIFSDWEDGLQGLRGGLVGEEGWLLLQAGFPAPTTRDSRPPVPGDPMLCFDLCVHGVFTDEEAHAYV